MNAPTTAFATHLDPDTVQAETIAAVIAGITSADEIWRERDDLMAELDPYQLMIDLADNDEVRDEILQIIVTTNKMPLARKWLLDRCRLVAEDSGDWVRRRNKDRADDAAIDAAVEARNECHR